tara:strand:+ start:84 stop:515 length:432 start_codon:yes stop_codon:yes gene_type:complete
MNRRGSQAIEFALILPVFLMLVFGGIDFLWLMIETAQVQQATAAGCRGGAATGVNAYTDPYARAQELIEDTLFRTTRYNCSLGGCDVAVTESDLSSPEVLWMRCDLEVSHSSITGFIPGMPDTIAAAAEMPIARPIIIEEEYE